MKKKRILKAVGFFLVLVMLLGVLSACQKTAEPDPSATPKPTQTPAATVEPTPTPTPTPRSTTPLVVGYLEFSEKFSPYFADSGYDNDVVGMTQVGLLTTDRTGAIVYNAIEGETINYNGTDYLYTGIADVKVDYDEGKDQTTYLWTIRDDVKFSDGHLMDADDVIFTYYVYSDPGYVGSSTLYSVPILGMSNYRTQTSDEVFAKYDKMWDDIQEAGADHEWASTDSWTKDQQDAFTSIKEEVWKADVQAIVDYCWQNYQGYYVDYGGGVDPEAAKDEPRLKIVAGMVLWGFGSRDGEVLTSAVLGKTWDQSKGEYPTIDDYYAETVEAYANNLIDYAGVESPGENAAKAAKKIFTR